MSSALALDRPPATANRRRRIGAASRHLLLLAFTLLSLLPVYFMVVSALKTKSEFTGNQMGLPLAPTLTSMTEALKGGDLYLWLFNSFLITTASVLVSTALAALAAYPLSLMRWPSGRLVLGLLIALLVVPPIVLVIPLFQMVVDVNQLNTTTRSSSSTRASCCP